MSYETKNCVRCLEKRARIWSGHVIKGKSRVIAGWCRRCYGKHEGFVGRYLKDMGKRKWVA